jgi:pimeloyl-ACP methyl ester carboxylesterase
MERLAMPTLFLSPMRFVCRWRLAALLSAALFGTVGAAAEPSVLLPGLPNAAFGRTQFWTDELIAGPWRIQRNAFTNSFRLLDGQEYRRACGSFQECRDCLRQLSQDQLPRPKGKVVIALHGLVRFREVMEDVAQHLEKEKGFDVVEVSYASTRRSLEEHAESLDRVIRNLDVDEVNFVAHSLGNLVVRRWLAMREEKQVDLPRVGRMVMIAPPNQGAVMARIWRDNKLFGLVMGPSGKQLAETWEEVEPKLAIPKCEFGIIAGTGGYNPLLPGDDDWVVSVAETRLAGAKDFATFPDNHGQLLGDERVHEAVAGFLTHGRFAPAAEDVSR